MAISEKDLLRILDVPTAFRESTLREAITQCRYIELRPYLSASDFVPLLEAHPETVDAWKSYCEDKRAAGGWWVDVHTRSVGSLQADEEFVVETGEKAIAEFVIRELDYWAKV